MPNGVGEKFFGFMGHEYLISYHIGEEFIISLICLAVARRALLVSRSIDPEADLERRSRTFLIGAGFGILGLNSGVHAFIHAADLNLNLLYQTLVGYCLGLLTLIVAIATERPWDKRVFPLLYVPTFALLFPSVYESFPIFTQFRPLMWTFIAYLSGVVSILYVSAYYHTRLNRFMLSALGHVLICTSAIALFFPTGIGSTAWIYGHFLRPAGFGILFFSMNREELLNLRESMLYKVIMTFSLLAAVPLMVFGMVLFYDNIYTIDIAGRRIMIFLTLLVTLLSALLFGLGMIIRLIRPILRLRRAVDRIAEQGLDERIETQSGDEIGKLSEAFNDMVMKLKQSFSERDRLSRLAATGELAATLAHEIKNPLNAIGGAAVYIGKNFKGSLIREFVTIINNEVSRINKLTSNLLNFAKPLKPEPEPADLNKLVEDTVSLLRQDSDDHGLTIETELQPDMPLASFDYNQIKQVLINLLLNSFDAVGREGRIKVTTHCSNGNVLLDVQDNGSGIRQEDMDKIFNPFYTTKTRGTGLGLAMSKKTVGEHGGDILVHSAPGRGSVFTVVLPRKASPANGMTK
jgi:signal transduction histidine kinase